MPIIEQKSHLGSFYAASSRASNLKTIASGSTCTPDLTLGDTFFFTANQNFTLNAPNLGSGGAAGTKFFLYISQDATGSRTWTLNSTYKTATSAANTLSTTAQFMDLIEAYWDGMFWNLIITKGIYASASYYRPNGFNAGTNGSWLNTANITDGTITSPGVLDTTTSGSVVKTAGTGTFAATMSWATQAVNVSNCTLYIRVAAGNSSGSAMTLDISLNGGSTYTNLINDGGVGVAVANYSYPLSNYGTITDLTSFLLRFTGTRVSNLMPPPATVTDNWVIYDCYIAQTT